MQQTCQARSARYRRYSLFSIHSLEVDGARGVGDRDEVERGRCTVLLA